MTSFSIPSGSGEAAGVGLETTSGSGEGIITTSGSGKGFITSSDSGEGIIFSSGSGGSIITTSLLTFSSAVLLFLNTMVVLSSMLSSAISVELDEQ